jgi:hypothetical protein
MASNFKILIHKSAESLHLKLMGDFDGTSAHELLNTIEDYGARMNKIFIHTSGLKDIYPFGKAVFQNHFSSINKSSKIVIFTGEHMDQIAPGRIGIRHRA